MVSYKKRKIIQSASHCIYNRSGQSLVDILIGIVLLIASINAAIVLVFGGQSALTNRENATQAGALAREGIDAAKAVLKENWGETADGIYGLFFSTSTGKWQFAGNEDTFSIFTRRISIKSLNNNEKTVSSTVSWTYNPLKLESVEFVTLVTNWKMIQESGGDTGGGGISGDWQNPATLGSVDLGAGNSATDLDVKNKIVYITAAASDSKKPDFFIIDVTNGQNPLIKSSTSTGSGLNAVDVAGNYAYLGNNSTNAQLQIVDVSNLLNPVLIKSFKLPGVSGSGAIGNTVFYHAGKVYIGTKKANGPEFHIIDVTNPVSPVALGSFEINADVNSIFVKNNIAYAANSSDAELIILDVKNPASISQIGSYDALGDTEDGKTIQVVGNKLYLGRLLGGDHSNHHELHIIDVSSSSVPQKLGSKDLAADLNDLYIRDSLAFVATSDANKEFQVWNISNPSNISLWSSFNFPQVATGIDYEDNIVYVAVRSNDALRIITSR